MKPRVNQQVGPERPPSDAPVAGRVGQVVLGAAGRQVVVPLCVARRCQDCVRHELNGRLKRLFHELTDLSLEVVWHCLPAANTGPAEPPCPRLRGVGDGSQPLAEACARCLRRHWRARGLPGRPEHRFRGACGLETRWVFVRGPGLCPAQLILQARVENPAARQPRGPGGVSRRRFEQAGALLRFAQRELELALETEELKHALLNETRLRCALEAEDRRLRREVHARLPAVPAEAPRPATASRAEQLVERMVECVRRHHFQPLSLRELALELGMNASYLSSVFSRTTGVTFHRYLDEVRLAEACTLLRDPRHRVAEVASRVGYASEDWFRHAFKQHTGLAPSAWRNAHAPGRTQRPKKPPVF